MVSHPTIRSELPAGILVRRPLVLPEKLPVPVLRLHAGLEPASLLHRGLGRNRLFRSNPDPLLLVGCGVLERKEMGLAARYLVPAGGHTHADLPCRSTDPGWLQGDTIASSSWSVSGPDALLVVDSDTNSTTVTTVYLSGGTIGVTYTVTNHVITSSGLEDDRSIRITMIPR